MNMIIIGGVAGGATAAARLRRINEDMDITVFERTGYISYANCGLPYYIGGDIQDRKKLVLQTPKSFFDRYKITIKTETEVTEIDRKKKKIFWKKTDGSTGESEYDKLLLSQGGSAFLPSIEGLPANQSFTIKNIEDTDRLFGFIKENEPKHAIIIGGGFIGLEMAEAFVQKGIQVSIVEMADRVMATMDPEFSFWIQKDLQAKGMNMHFGNVLKKYNSITKTAELENGVKISADFILFSAGVVPEKTLAEKSGLKIGKSGGILVNHFLETSDPDIYAVGDMIEIEHKIDRRKIRIPLAGPANRQGRIAANNICGIKTEYKGASGSAVMKIFEKTAAFTGFSETVLSKSEIPYGAVTVYPNHHAGYYPGAQPLVLKLMYHKETGKVLGAAAYGKEGVEKRIDVVATAIAGNMTVHDLSETDLCYAPPYSSANDPVNMASFVAENNISGFSNSISVEEFIKVYKSNSVLLDVRDKKEFESGGFKAALHIPVNDLRENLQKLDKQKTIFIHCAAGYRGHLAYRILKQNGFNSIYNISGGFKSMEPFFNKIEEITNGNR